MKYLAILKDSFLEAVDAKIFYVMVGLSLLLALLVGCISYQPVPALDFMQEAAQPLNGEINSFVGRGARVTRVVSEKQVHYQVTAVEVLDGKADGPESSYRVAIQAHYPDMEEAAKARKDPAAAEDIIRNKFGATGVELAGVRRLNVAEVQMLPAKDGSGQAVDFTVTTSPTPATRRMWKHTTSFLFGAVPLKFLGAWPLGLQILFIEDNLINGIGAWIALIIGVIITAFFIPNMLRKGTVDLLLVKPIHRWTLLIVKYVGGLAFIFLTTAVAVVGVWVALGLQSGIWAPGFLLVVPVLTFFFAILYAVSTFFAVTTRSPVVAIIMTIGVWFGLYIVGQAFTFFEVMRVEEERFNVPAESRMTDGWWVTTVNAVHFVLPRPKDLDRLTSRVLARELLTGNQVSAQDIDKTRIDWAESLTVSFVFIALMLGLSCLWFSTRDY